MQLADYLAMTREPLQEFAARSGLTVDTIRPIVRGAPAATRATAVKIEAASRGLVSLAELLGIVPSAGGAGPGDTP